MQRPLVFATRNKGKLYELRALVDGLDLDVIDLTEVAARLGRELPDTIEDAPTFAGNAGKNAAGQTVYGAISSPGHEPSVITVGAANLFATLVRFVLFRSWIFGGSR